MLAAVTSLALLTHSATHAAPAFNDIFYATTATIIPVLFLALTVQGGAITDLVTAKRFGPWVAGFIVGACCTGEIEAVFALYKRSASTNTAQGVLAVTIFLIVAVGALPFVTTIVASERKSSVEQQEAHRRAAR
jgi:hypothetical protein